MQSQSLKTVDDSLIMHRLKTTIKIAITIVLFQLHAVHTSNSSNSNNWERVPMRYLDHNSRNHDFFFDRAVPLVLEMPNGIDTTVIAIGVIISSDRILTSYNPFRQFIHNKTILDKIFAVPFKVRTAKLDPNSGSYYELSVSYFYSIRNIACGRQIIPDEENTMHLCHGKNGFDCPLHDLMVLRIVKRVTITNNPITKYSQFVKSKFTRVEHGYYRTEIARPNDTLNDYIKFASVGFRSEYHIKEHRVLHKVNYEPEQSAVVDCDRWLPREWGHFICVLNLGNYPALGSSALLVSDKKVFGIGSFALFRGKVGVFVFTDVRPYYDLIMNTCTVEDSRE